MELVRGIHTLSPSNTERVTAEAADQQAAIHFIRGDHVVDRDSFFDAVRATLPLFPPVFSRDNWDALSDSIWNGLNELNTTRVLIIWSDSHHMKESPEDFEMALNVLEDVIEGLASPQATVGKPKEVTVLLA